MNKKHHNFEMLFYFIAEVKIKGTVLRIESKDYYVLSEQDDIVRCNLRGKIKKELSLKKGKLYLLDPVAVGDIVEYDLNFDGTGTIEKIYERKNYLSRKAPKQKGSSFRGERLEQIIAANIDQLFIVASIDNPKFNNRLIDRILVAAESGGIDAKIIINKSDLGSEDELSKWSELYTNIGYEVFVTSVKHNSGFEDIVRKLKWKTSCFWGMSGVGKSSILNRIYPGLQLRIGEVSDYNNKGRHTTVTVQMIKVEDETFVIDTPGIREIEPYGIKKEDLGHYFIEFKNYLFDCKFSSCTHNHEPKCAVREAVEQGKISKERYISYLNMLATIDSDVRF